MSLSEENRLSNVFRGPPWEHESDPYCETIWESLVRCIQQTIEQVCFPNPPLIIYSEQRKDDSEWDWDTGNLPPIDYLGAYFCGDSTCTGYHTEEPPDGRRIEMYHKRIEKCAYQLHSKQIIVADKPLDLETINSSLERIVFIHEIFHGFLHLGCGYWWEEVPVRPTNNKIMEHLKERLELWKELPKLVVEQHAQLGTWHIISDDPIDRAVFSKLMEKQPQEYILDSALKLTPSGRLWSWMCYMRRHDGKHMRAYDGMIQYLLTGELSEEQELINAINNF